MYKYGATHFVILCASLALAGCDSTHTQSISKPVSSPEPAPIEQPEAPAVPASPIAQPEQPAEPEDNSEEGDTPPVQGGNNPDTSGGEMEGSAPGGTPEQPPAPTTPEPENSLLTFSGSDFYYPSVRINYVEEEDARSEVVVQAPSHTIARASIEARHALSFYSDAYVPPNKYELDDIKSYCPSSGEDSAADRCEHYVTLAYNKTLVYDGWQGDAFPFGTEASICSDSNGNCYFMLSGSFDHGYQGDGTSDHMLTVSEPVHKISPIEGWAYRQEHDRVRSVNDAIHAHSKCVGWDQDDSMIRASEAWFVSFWPEHHFTVWTLGEDALNDIGRDISAANPYSHHCNSDLLVALDRVK